MRTSCSELDIKKKKTRWSCDKFELHIFSHNDKQNMNQVEKKTYLLLEISVLVKVEIQEPTEEYLLEEKKSW